MDDKPTKLIYESDYEKHFTDMRIYAEHRMWSDLIHVGIGIKDGADRFLLTGLVGTKIEEGASAPLISSSGTLVLTPDQAQMLMDALWSVGVRPTEGTGSAGALAATQAHLADAREATKRLFTMIEYLVARTPRQSTPER